MNEFIDAFAECFGNGWEFEAFFAVVAFPLIVVIMYRAEPTNDWFNEFIRWVVFIGFSVGLVVMWFNIIVFAWHYHMGATHCPAAGIRQIPFTTFPSEGAWDVAEHLHPSDGSLRY